MCVLRHTGHSRRWGHNAARLRGARRRLYPLPVREVRRYVLEQPHERPFPSVFKSQLPTYFAEIPNGSLKLNPEETIYTLWIGTNDVGANALLTGGQAPGVTIADTVACAVDWVSTLYKSGARNFIFQNVSLFVPAQLPKFPKKGPPLTRCLHPARR